MKLINLGLFSHGYEIPFCPLFNQISTDYDQQAGWGSGWEQ